MDHDLARPDFHIVFWEINYAESCSQIAEWYHDADIGPGNLVMGESSSAKKDEIAALQHGIDLGMTLIDTAGNVCLRRR